MLLCRAILPLPLLHAHSPLWAGQQQGRSRECDKTPYHWVKRAYKATIHAGVGKRARSPPPVIVFSLGRVKLPDEGTRVGWQPP